MQDSDFRPALADVMLAAARCVAAVRAGRSLNDALAEVPAAPRPAVQAVAFHAMRTLGTAMALRQVLVPRRPPGALPDALLLVALSLADAAARHAAGAPAVPGVPLYAPHTLVDQAVRATAHKPLRPYKGLVNATLRRFLREREDVMAQLAGDEQAVWNHPPWWIDALRSAYPGRWESLLGLANRPAALTLRVNRRRARRDQVLEVFARAGIAAQPVLEDGLTLAEARPVTQLPGYEQGWWSVQDAGAQLAAPLLPLRDGMRVLDACAAPGGKTAHLLESADIELLALDADAGRLARVGQNLERLGLTGPGVALAAADAADPAAWWDGRPFDAVLADVPCTASGIVRRHPDIRWLRRRADVARAAALQRRIADALWTTVAPGGRMLYATCSIFPAECREQAEAFARRHPDAEALPADGQLLPSAGDAPPAAQHDGFFYALFAKRA